MADMRIEAGRLNELAAALSKVNDPATIQEFLHGILTPRERENIALRWELSKRLEKKESQRAIAEELGVSLCKITRGSRELKKGPGGFRKVVKKAVADEKG